MELRHLRYFVAVAEELHFSRAAARLNMSQPPLSRQIQELEEEIGVPLFVRENRKVQLTPAGKVYLAQAKRILEHVAAANYEAAAVALGRAGPLRLGHGTHLPAGFLSRVLAAFHKEAPHVAVDLLESPTPRILKALRQKTIDVGFVMAPSNTAGLVVKPLFSDRLVIALPEGHRYAAAPLTDLYSWHTKTSCSAGGTPTPATASSWKGSAARPASRHACCRRWSRSKPYWNCGARTRRVDSAGVGRRAIDRRALSGVSTPGVACRNGACLARGRAHGVDCAATHPRRTRSRAFQSKTRRCRQ